MEEDFEYKNAKWNQVIIIKKQQTACIPIIKDGANTYKELRYTKINK
jgi:hypothetical protein